MAICDSQLYFSRDVKVYIKINADIWEIPVLDGFSFAQANNSSEITLAEMESSTGVSRRGKRMFNDSLAPAEWSFTTYARPFVAVPGVAGGEAEPTIANVHAVEEVLWALAAGPAIRNGQGWWDGTTDYFTLGLAESIIDFATSNTSTLGTASIFFVLQTAGLTYEIQEAAVNEATVNFDIDGIAQIEWSGMGAEIIEGTEPTPTIYEAINATDNFIRNRLTSLSIAPVKTGDDTGAYTLIEEGFMETSYDLTLTGGSITLSNNLTYLTPEELGKVNIPLGHITGTRSFSGTFTNYLVTDVTTDKSADFWSDIKSLTSVITHDFAVTFAIGGAAGAKRVEFTLPHAHIETPTHSVEDVISVETSFTGLGECINSADEMTIKYVA